MFDSHTSAAGRDLPGYTMVSMGAHALLVAAFVALASMKVKEAVRKEVEVSFVGPGKGKGAPPAPAAPAARKRSTPMPHRKLLAKIEVPKPILELPNVVAPEESEPEEEGEVAGVEGGVAGGVVGGVAGGVPGGTGGGGSMQPTQAERPKAKNVPAFAIARDMVRQSPPRMSEVFRNSHRGQTVSGMYRVCVDTDGSVYEVVPVKAVDGANDEIVEGIKGDWLYKPQQVPVCFLYNMVVRIEQ